MSASPTVVTLPVISNSSDFEVRSLPIVALLIVVFDAEVIFAFCFKSAFTMFTLSPVNVESPLTSALLTSILF